LTLGNINLGTRTLKVRIKGGRWGNGAYCQETADWINQWIGIRQTVAKPETKALFVSIKGIHPGTPITRDGLRSIFRRMGKAADLGLISPHDIRRTFATLAIKNGASTRLVQVAGRWQNIREVERYTQQLKPEDMAAYSPVNKILVLDSAEAVRQIPRAKFTKKRKTIVKFRKMLRPGGTTG
jgi:integrase